jgi:hypothetical protein
MSATDKGGRDAKGRFTKNNPGGPGNPFARQVAALRSALVNKVTPEDIEDVVNILLLKAKQGDLAAVKLLFSYVLGKPAELVLPNCRRSEGVYHGRRHRYDSGSRPSATGRVGSHAALFAWRSSTMSDDRSSAAPPRARAA